MLTELALNAWVSRSIRGAFDRWAQSVGEHELEFELNSLAESHWRCVAIAMAWRAWREAPLAAALSAIAKRHANRSRLKRVLRSWNRIAATRQLEFHRQQLADDIRRQSTVMKAFTHWANVTRIALMGHLEDEMAATAVDHWETTVLSHAFERWRDDAWERELAEELNDRAEVHRLWRLGAQCLRAWYLRCRQKNAETFAYDAAASIDSRRRRRCVMIAWFRHTIAAYVGREGLARRLLRRWHGATSRAVETRKNECVATAHVRKCRIIRAYHAWLRVWLLNARARLFAETRVDSLARRAVRAWLRRARRKMRNKVNLELAEAHHQSRTLGRCFAALTHVWARAVLLKALTHRRCRREIQFAWRAWVDGRRHTQEMLWMPFTWWAEYTCNVKLHRLQENKTRENQTQKSAGKSLGKSSKSEGKQAAFRRAAKAALNRSPSTSPGGLWKY